MPSSSPPFGLCAVPFPMKIRTKFEIGSPVGAAAAFGVRSVSRRVAADGDHINGAIAGASPPSLWETPALGGMTPSTPTADALAGVWTEAT